MSSYTINVNVAHKIKVAEAKVTRTWRLLKSPLRWGGVTFPTGSIYGVDEFGPFAIKDFSINKVYAYFDGDKVFADDLRKVHALRVYRLNYGYFGEVRENNEHSLTTQAIINDHGVAFDYLGNKYVYDRLRIKKPRKESREMSEHERSMREAKSLMKSHTKPRTRQGASWNTQWQPKDADDYWR